MKRNRESFKLYDMEENVSVDKGKRKKIIIISAIALVFVVTIVSLYGYFLEKNKPLEEDYAVKANDMVEASETPTPTPTVEPTKESEPEILESLAPYYEKNKELIGWLKIEDTPIDYPVMYTPDDEEYYLTRDFDGNDSSKGTLFIDAQSKVCEPNYNVIIYGHNMKDQSMFGSLKKYADYDFYKEHKTITFNTLYEESQYEVVAAFYAKVLLKTDTSFKYYKFTYANNKEEFDDFVTNVKQMSEYDTGVTAEYGDQLITMSTCSYHVENGRFAVVAKKIENSNETK